MRIVVAETMTSMSFASSSQAGTGADIRRMRPPSAEALAAGTEPTLAAGTEPTLAAGPRDRACADAGATAVDAEASEEGATGDSGTDVGVVAVAGRCGRPPIPTPCGPVLRRSPARDAATAAICACLGFGFAPQAERKRAFPPSAWPLPVDASVRLARMVDGGARRGGAPRTDISREKRRFCCVV